MKREKTLRNTVLFSIAKNAKLRQRPVSYSLLTLQTSLHSLQDFSLRKPHSVLKFFTGLATAALIAWKLTVANATINARIADKTNTHQ